MPAAESPSVRALLLSLLAIALVNTLLLAFACIKLSVSGPRPPAASVTPHHGHGAEQAERLACDSRTCGATDPVSDPAYNMREVAKQSILLEEHLTIDAKFCVDCVTKHFLHIIGLANEASMLACSADAERFPLLQQVGPTYERLFGRWLATRDLADARDDRLAIASEMRDFRKRLVGAYFAPGGHAAPL